ncbi:MAG: hypothetical protein IJ689_07250 [Alphaproteobacteria bacterium]|nr:hypothetical protein [Alphaproteobacteria bacterium]
MKNYILMLGVAGVALGSYCAYAGNSATMTVTATIAHDVSLSVTQDLSLGTITINPAYIGYDTEWGYSDSGIISFNNQGAIVSAPNAAVGIFTANIPNPSACDKVNSQCGGLQIVGNSSCEVFDFFGGGGDDNYCDFAFKYSGSSNTFKVFPEQCGIGTISQVTYGTHIHTLTIDYYPE